MTIYIVRAGDTLEEISRRYGVSIDRIRAANGLKDIPRLAVGQALVIPTTESPYVVQAGDSLWSISRKFGISIASIMALNGITDQTVLMPGMVLRIPQPANQYGYIETNAYIEPSTTEVETQLVDEAGRYLSYISPFSYQVNPDGSLREINDRAILEAAGRHQVAGLLTVTNFSNGNFDTELASNILQNQDLQDALINNLISIMGNKGYYGVNIDFERVDPDERQLYNDFLRRVVAALHPHDYAVSTALAPKSSDEQTGAWHGAHDYEAHGEIVDFVILMTYEWGWSGGPPRAVAPIDLVEEVVQFAVSVMPAHKIFMGMPLYGYDWTLPFVEGGRWARRVSPQEAVNLAASHGVEIRYDYDAQSPYFNYTNSDGKEHEVWFEDTRSVQAKLVLASEYGLRGVSYWVLGSSFPQNWVVLDEMFNIVKLIE